jgi:DNA-binding response OmpR family regulator
MTNRQPIHCARVATKPPVHQTSSKPLQGIHLQDRGSNNPSSLAVVTDGTFRASTYPDGRRAYRSVLDGTRSGVMKLLIAEDDAFFVKILRQVLAPDYELIVASDGGEAWEILQSPDAPRLAILDWVMPRLSGPEICRRVRGSERISSTYLIILTSKNSTADIVAGLRAGADDYITKPPVPEELRARVRMGERVLALQDVVEAQSEVLHQPNERDQSFRKGQAGDPFCERPIVRENLREVAAYLSRQDRSAENLSSSRVEGSSCDYLLANCSMENSHS